MRIFIPSAFQAPRRWGLASGMVALFVFFSFVGFDQAERGKYAAFSVGAILFSVGIFWNGRKSTWFVSSVIIVLVIHVLFLVLIEPVNERLPAMTFVPFWILDALVVYVIFFICRKFVAPDA